MTLPISTPSLYQNIQQQKPQHGKPVQTPQASTAESSKSSKESALPTVLNASISQPIQVQIVPSAKNAKGKSQVNWAAWAFLGAFVSISTMGLWLPWVMKKIGKNKDSKGDPLDLLYQSPFQLIKETGVKFSDVLGADEAKKNMIDILDFIKHPEKYKKQGAVMPKGVLLHGPSGTGKTLLAKALAGEAGVPFLSSTGSSFNEMYIGVGASRARELFKEAQALSKKNKSPVIIFIDELDAVARKRGGWNAKEDDATLTQFLSSMDGMETSEHPIIVIGSTNLPLKELDPAMLRRLERQVEVALPDLIGRQALFEYYGKKYTLSDASKAYLATLAKNSMGFSPADIKNILNEAAILTARDNHKNITPEILEEAVDRVKIGSKRDLKRSKSEIEKTAYHEMGHAIVGHFLEDNFEVKKVTIVPRGGALGVTSIQPNHEDDLVTYSKIELINRMAMFFGGRAAEELIYGADNARIGASGDLEEIRNIALDMVGKYGFGEGLPPMNYSENPDFPHSEHLKQRLEKAVDEIVTQAEARAREVLKKQSNLLNKATDALLKEETLDAQAFKKLVNQYGVSMSGKQKSR